MIQSNQAKRTLRPGQNVQEANYKRQIRALKQQLFEKAKKIDMLKDKQKQETKARQHAENSHNIENKRNNLEVMKLESYLAKYKKMERLSRDGTSADNELGEYAKAMAEMEAEIERERTNSEIKRLDEALTEFNKLFAVWTKSTKPTRYK